MSIIDIFKMSRSELEFRFLPVFFCLREVYKLK